VGQAEGERLLLVPRERHVEGLGGEPYLMREAIERPSVEC
jgi:hypothetical protein